MFVRVCVLNGDSTVVKRYHNHGTCYKGKHLTGGLQFRGSLSYLHGRAQWTAGRHSAEKELRVYILISRKQEINWVYIEYRLSIVDLKTTPTVIYFLQQSHTYSHKFTSSNSGTPYEIMWISCIQTTTFGETTVHLDELNTLHHNVPEPCGSSELPKARWPYLS